MAQDLISIFSRKLRAGFLKKNRRQWIYTITLDRLWLTPGSRVFLRRPSDRRNPAEKIAEHQRASAQACQRLWNNYMRNATSGPPQTRGMRCAIQNAADCFSVPAMADGREKPRPQSMADKLGVDRRPIIRRGRKFCCGLTTDMLPHTVAVRSLVGLHCPQKSGSIGDSSLPRSMRDLPGRPKKERRCATSKLGPAPEGVWDQRTGGAGFLSFALDLRQLPTWSRAQWFAKPRDARSIGAM